MTVLKINAQELKRAVNKVYFAVSGDNHYPTLQNIFLHKNIKGVYELVATNGVIISRAILPTINKPNEDIKAILPLKLVKGIVKCITSKTPEISMNISPHYITFSEGVTTKLVPPPYLPEGYTLDGLRNPGVNVIYQVDIKPKEVKGLLTFLRSVKEKGGRWTQIINFYYNNETSKIEVKLRSNTQLTGKYYNCKTAPAFENNLLNLKVSYSLGLYPLIKILSRFGLSETITTSVSNCGKYIEFNSSTLYIGYISPLRGNVYCRG